MQQRLIIEFVNRLTSNDIENFAKQHGINLKESEIDLIYNYIKSDWQTIIFGDPRPIFDQLKVKLDSFTYNQIENLYRDFKEKYKHYL